MAAKATRLCSTSNNFRYVCLTARPGLFDVGAQPSSIDTHGVSPPPSEEDMMLKQLNSKLFWPKSPRIKDMTETQVLRKNDLGTPWGVQPI